MEQSGASHLAFEGSCESLLLDLSGACRTALRGRADRLEVGGSGVCHVAAAQFPVQRADVELSGASQARLNVTGELRTDLSGASNVEYSGGGNHVHNDRSGASHVKRVDEGEGR